MVAVQAMLAMMMSMFSKQKQAFYYDVDADDELMVLRVLMVQKQMILLMPVVVPTSL